MLVCIRSFRLDRDLDAFSRAGEAFSAGVTYVAADHPVVLAYPKYFAASTGVGGRALRAREHASSLSAPSRRDGRAQPTPLRRGRSPRVPLDAVELPELRAKATPRPVEFYISDYGLDAIRQELRDNRELLETGGETGGWLFGRRDTFRKYQLLPTSLGSDGERSHHSVLLGLQPKHERERRAAATGDRDLLFLGSWHVHPYAKGYDKPSHTDRRNTLARLDRGESAYARPATFALDLIITPDPMRAYSRPRFHLWLTDRSALAGKPVTIPALFPETLPHW